MRSANSFGEWNFWAFSQYMTDTDLSAKTRCDRLLIVKQCFKYARRTKLIAAARWRASRWTSLARRRQISVSAASAEVAVALRVGQA